MRTVYRNARIHDPSTPGASALLVEDATIAWIGPEAALAAQPDAQVVDLDGALVTPAFVDAHIHTTATGLALTGLDLSAAESLADALTAVERAARASRGRPLLGSGWDETRWPEQRPPTATELDRAAYGGAVYLSRVDAHSAAISSALAAAVPALATFTGFRRDGWLTRDAHDAARTAAFAALTAGQVTDAQRAALRHAASLGIACVHEMAGPAISSADDLTNVLALAAAEPLPEVIGYWGELFGIDTARELGAVGAGGDLFCDGSLGSHTAALYEPYDDRPQTSGVLRFETGELAEHIRRCTAAGLQAGFHAIGDAAVDQVLDALDLVSGAGGAGHRLEHAELVRDPRRLAASGLLASMQPAFDAAWGGSSGMYARRLGEQRAGALNRFAELAAAGVPMAFGSDSPVTPLAPWAAVRAAVHPSDPAAGISTRAAFAAHTRGGWRAAGRDAEGVLAPGAPATFAAWRTAEPGPDAPRAGAPALPDVSPGVALPTCVLTVRRGTTIFDPTQPSGAGG